MKGIFVSYRRADAAGWTGRIVDALKRGFPAAPVFYDLSTIKGGQDFADSIQSSLDSCSVLLALIGPRWLSAATPDGARRLDDPNDFVRTEVKTCLERGIYVIPVLVGGASIPRPEELPADLAPLARFQAQELTDIRWEYDCDQLLAAMEKPLGVPVQKTSPGDASAAGAISVGSGMVIKRSKVGDIVGVKGAARGPANAPGRPIEVGRDAVVEDSDIGDVAGIKETQTKPGAPSAQ